MNSPSDVPIVVQEVHTVTGNREPSLEPKEIEAFAKLINIKIDYLGRTHYRRAMCVRGLIVRTT